MFLKRIIVSQTKIETVSNATLGKRLKDEMERIIMGFSERIDTILNWTDRTDKRFQGVCVMRRRLEMWNHTLDSSKSRPLNKKSIFVFPLVSCKKSDQNWRFFLVLPTQILSVSQTLFFHISSPMWPALFTLSPRWSYCHRRRIIIIISHSHHHHHCSSVINPLPVTRLWWGCWKGQRNTWGLCHYHHQLLYFNVIISIGIILTITTSTNGNTNQQLQNEKHC